MKCFYTTRYKLYKEKIKDLKILVMSDIHFNNVMTDEKLSYILEYIKKENPNYIFIAGDLVDSLDMIDDVTEKERLIAWIKNLANITNLIIIPGNHDDYYKFDKKWIKGSNQEFLNEMKNIKNVYYLDNSNYEDENIFVTGGHASFEYYHPNLKLVEDRTTFIKELRLMIPDTIPNNKIKFFLFHSPIWLKDKEVTSILKEYDYFISGHMHNGCVPPIMHELWSSDIGIISPNSRLLAHNTRNVLVKPDDKLIVNGAVTTFHTRSGIMRMFNVLFPIYNTVLEFANDKKYDKNKVFIKRKYHK